MRKIVLMFITCCLWIASMNAQDFVQPVQSGRLRIKKQKAEHQENKRQRTEIKDFDYQHFKLSVNAGYSTHTDPTGEKIPSPLTEYVKDLKSGSNFGIDLQYYPVEPVGFGVKYLGYNGRLSKAVLSTSSFKYSTINQNLSVQFLGPSISARYLHADMKNTLYFNMAYGYVFYHAGYQSDVEFRARGNTMATTYDLGYDFGLTQNIGIGFQVSYLKGILKEYKSTFKEDTQNVILESGKQERLHRLDFSIGFKLNL